MSGLLGKALCNGNVQELGVVPGDAAENSSCSVNIHVTNTTSTDKELVVYISTNFPPSEVDTVYARKIIPGYGDFSASCHLCSTGERIIVNGSVGLVARAETTRPED